MNDDDLRQKLRDFKAPEASESARGRARHRALIAFAQARTEPKSQRQHRTWAWNWRHAVVLGLLVGILPFLFTPHHPTRENLANDRQLLQQVEKMFPHQVDAVVEKNGKVDLSIAQSPVVGSGQPVLLVFKRGSESIRVLSYSGHHVCLDLGQQHRCFEILATPSGGVILEAQDAVWLSSEHPVVAGYAVRAQMLGASL